MQNLKLPRNRRCLLVTIAIKREPIQFYLHVGLFCTASLEIMMDHVTQWLRTIGRGTNRSPTEGFVDYSAATYRAIVKLNDIQMA